MSSIKKWTIFLWGKVSDIDIKKATPLLKERGPNNNNSAYCIKSPLPLTGEDYLPQFFIAFIKVHSFPGWDKAFISIKYQIKTITGSLTPSFDRLIALLVRAMG